MPAAVLFQNREHHQSLIGHFQSFFFQNFQGQPFSAFFPVSAIIAICLGKFPFQALFFFFVSFQPDSHTGLE